MQELEWLGSDGVARSAEFVGHLFTLVSKINKTIPLAGTVFGNCKGLPPLFKSKQSEQLGNQEQSSPSEMRICWPCLGMTRGNQAYQQDCNDNI